MDIIIIIILIILTILVISYSSTIKGEIDSLYNELNQIKYHLKNLQNSYPENIEKQDKSTEKNSKEATLQAENIELATEPEHEPELESKISEAEETVRKPEPVPQYSEPKNEHKFETQQPETGKRRDLEKFIGEHLSKIGIVILVLGIGYFVKYAIDKDWINEYGRTIIGLLAGGILIGLAHILRNSYKTFSSVLTGGGLAVLYLTIAIAFHQYHIFSQTVSFILMIGVTALSVFFSLLYNKKELAIFSQLGGYAAPFMISTGEENYIIQIGRAHV
jgi:uncharacterized membrane protein